jgi:hypothetical protein
VRQHEDADAAVAGRGDLGDDEERGDDERE